MTPARGALSLLACAWATACAAVVRDPFPPPLVPDGPETAVVAGPRRDELVGRARAYERATGLYSAVVRVEVRDLARGGGFEARGGLAVDRARGAVRLQMLGPGGVTALDLLARDGRYWLQLAGRGWTARPLDAPAPSGFPAGALARAFLGFDWDAADVARDGALAVARVPSPPGYALVSFAARDGVTREVRWFARGEEVSRVRFAAFARDGDAPSVPAVALFWQRSPALSATLTVEQRRESPELPERTFAPP